MVGQAVEHARLAGAAHALDARAGGLDAGLVEGIEYGLAGRHRDGPAAARQHHLEAALDRGRLGGGEMLHMNASRVAARRRRSERIEHAARAAAVELGIRRRRIDDGGNVEAARRRARG